MFRYFDTAPGYGNGLSEYRLGHALRQHLDDGQAVLSTKVGRVLTPTLIAPTITAYQNIPPLVAGYDYSYNGCHAYARAESAAMLTDHFDMLLVHEHERQTHGDDYPDYLRQAVVSAFPALEALREKVWLGRSGSAPTTPT